LGNPNESPKEGKMTQSDRHCLGEWKPDPLHELWVRAWTAYYQAADRIDGHIVYPRTNDDYKTCKRAIIAGNYAMSEVFDDKHALLAEKHGKISQNAKKEALRRLGKG
jgi:hypothetical protein